MNLTHSEAAEPFLARYGARARAIAPLLDRFDAARAAALGARIWASRPSSAARAASFPTDMKAAPMLRAWLHRLRGAGRAIPYAASLARLGDERRRLALRHARTAKRTSRPMRRCWRSAARAGRGWARTAPGCRMLRSARRARRAVRSRRTAASTSAWSAAFQRSRIRGRAAASRWRSGCDARGRRATGAPGEFLITATGIEGSLVYALSAPIRDAIAARGASDDPARPAARPQRRGACSRRSDASARRPLDVEPSAEPARHRRREGGLAARMRRARKISPIRRRLAAAHQVAAAAAGARRGRSPRRSAAPAASRSKRSTRTRC